MMTAPVDLIGFLVLGFLGGFGHCTAMCSPFALMLSRQTRSAPERPDGRGGFMRYTVGRILTYATLGGAAGALGQAMSLAGTLFGIQRGAMLLAGATLIVWAMAGLLGRVGWTTGGRWITRLTLRLGTQLPARPFVMGLVLGLLPCGLVYTAVVGAVAMGSAWRGATALALFGLGTIPALGLLSLADRVVVQSRPLLNLLAHTYVLVAGFLLIWRGWLP